MIVQDDYLSENINNHNLFLPYTNSQSKVTFYILSKKVAPVQQSFYFVNDGLSSNGRYLWFYCAYPPSKKRTLGIVDFKTKTVRNYPETQFDSASPFVDTLTGEVYWGRGDSIWKRGPEKKDSVELVNTVPEEIIKNRQTFYLATHLTRTNDNKDFFIDAHIGLQYIFGKLPINGDSFEHWYTFNRCYNHAQFSPKNDIVLLAQEMHKDIHTGLTYPITNRLWKLEEGKSPQSILKQPRWVSHEWWDPDGQHVWCVWDNETWRVNITTGEIKEKFEFPYHCWHSHSSLNGKYIISDSNEKFFRGCPSTVYFFNKETDKIVKVIDNPKRTDYAGKNYHIDPHPRFCCGDKYIVFTTTIRGEIDLALIPVEELINKTLV